MQVPEQRTTTRRRALGATILVVTALAGINLAEHVLGLASLWLGPSAAVLLLLFARWNGLTWAQLGLCRTRLTSGLRWGGAAIGLVAMVYLAGVLFPPTREAFLDSRYHLPVSGALLSAFVIIPASTILLEEIAFRSVLWATLARHAPTWRVMATSSLLFGLWHVLPAMGLGSGNAAVSRMLGSAGVWSVVLLVGGTVVFTALGGVVAGELRRRSGSLIASVGMHWATNALGVLFGLAAWQLAT